MGAQALLWALAALAAGVETSAHPALATPPVPARRRLRRRRRKSLRSRMRLAPLLASMDLVKTPKMRNPKHTRLPTLATGHDRQMRRRRRPSEADRFAS